MTVLNGTSTAGLAATYGDKVEGKGFGLGAVSNTDPALRSQRGHVRTRPQTGSEEGRQTAADPDVELMSPEVKTASAGANVAVVVGEDNAEAAG